MNDLKQHVKTTHTSIYPTLPVAFFTVGAGFFLSVHPQDYRRIAQASPYDQEECFEARKAALRWCSSQLNASRVTTEWRTGWLEAKALENKPAQLTVPSKRPPPLEEDDIDFDKDPEVYLDETAPQKKSKMELEPTATDETDSNKSATTEIEDESHDERHVNVVSEEELTSAITLIERMEDPDNHTSGDRDVSSLRPASPALHQGPSVPAELLTLSPAVSSSIPQVTSNVSETSAVIPTTFSELPIPAAIPAEPSISTHEEEKTPPKDPEFNVPNSDKVPTEVIVPAPVAPAVDKTIQERAESLLRFGLMPLCAPARRDWSKGGLFSLEVGGKEFPWPPMGWTGMTSDQRLLAVEFAANTIEFNATGSFPALSRCHLLDKYNFLVLPGTAKIRRTETEKNHNKSRFYTYQQLRRITLSTHTTKEDLDTVAFYERAQKGGITDYIVNAIDKLKIPLRLKEENHNK